MAIDHGAERKAFEDKAYSIYFDGMMRGAQDAPWTLVLPGAMLTHDQFCALGTDGLYTNPALAAGWVFWQHRAQLDASGDLFAVIQDAHQALVARMALPAEDRGEAALADLTATLGAFILSIQALPQ